MARGVVNAINQVTKEANRIHEELGVIRHDRDRASETYKRMEENFNRASEAYFEAQERYQRARMVAQRNLEKLNAKNNDLNLLLGNQTGRPDAEVLDLIAMPMLEPLTEGHPETQRDVEESNLPAMDSICATGDFDDEDDEEFQESEDERSHTSETADIPDELDFVRAPYYREASIHSNIDVARPKTPEHEDAGSAGMHKSPSKQSDAKQSVNPPRSSPQPRPVVENLLVSNGDRSYETDSESDDELLFVSMRLEAGKKKMKPGRSSQGMKENQDKGNDNKTKSSTHAEAMYDDLFGEPVTHSGETGKMDIREEQGLQSTSTSPRNSLSNGYKGPTQEIASFTDQVVSVALQGSLRNSSTPDSMNSLFYEDQDLRGHSEGPRWIGGEVLSPRSRQRQSPAGPEVLIGARPQSPQRQRPYIDGQAWQSAPVLQQPNSGSRQAKMSTSGREKRAGRASEQQEPRKRKKRVPNPQGLSKGTERKLGL